jgi:signal peptidase I
VYVPVDDVVGKVIALIWPFGRAHVLHRPPEFSGLAASARPAIPSHSLGSAK